MALKVWLPLNKDLRSVGLSNVKVINSGATLDNNGIIGKCYNIPLGKYIGLDAKNVNNHKYSPISIAFWVYPTQNDSTSRSVFGCWENGGGGFYFKSQKMGFNFYIGGAYQSCEMPSTLSLNTWHHICGTYDEKVMRLYIDGVEVATTSVSGKITYHSTCPWEIGGNPGATAFAAGNFAGKFNDIRIYDNCISESDVKRLYQRKIYELVPYSGAKDVLFDRSGYCLMPMVNNGAVFNANSLYFDGGASTRLRPRNGNVGFGLTEGTLSIWFKPISKPSDYRLLVIDSTSKIAIGFYNSGNHFLLTSNGTSSQSFSSASIKYGELNNIIVGYTSNVPKYCIINGIAAAQNGGSSNWSETGGFTIGGRTYNNLNFNGTIYKVELHKKSLTSDEAIELYNSEKGMFLPDDYIQLEYIQSNGNQWIDTGIKGETRWVGCAQSVQNTTKSQTLLITQGGGNVGTFYGSVSNGNKWTLKGSPYSTNYDITSKQNFDILFKTTGPSGTIGDTSVNITTSCTLSTNWIISCERTTTYPYIGKIWPLKAYQQGLLVRNYIPSKRKSDNVIGLYDMVSRRFFTNSGTGSFTGA